MEQQKFIKVRMSTRIYDKTGEYRLGYLVDEMFNDDVLRTACLDLKECIESSPDDLSLIQLNKTFDETMPMLYYKGTNRTFCFYVVHPDESLNVRCDFLELINVGNILMYVPDRELALIAASMKHERIERLVEKELAKLKAKRLFNEEGMPGLPEEWLDQQMTSKEIAEDIERKP